MSGQPTGLKHPRRSWNSIARLIGHGCRHGPRERLGTGAVTPTSRYRTARWVRQVTLRDARRPPAAADPAQEPPTRFRPRPKTGQDMCSPVLSGGLPRSDGEPGKADGRIHAGRNKHRAPPGAGCASYISRRTRKTPSRCTPSNRAAFDDRSIMRPFTNGPRSLIRTMADRPDARSITRTSVPNGRNRCAAVSASGRYRSPFAVRVRRSSVRYQEARPTSEQLPSVAVARTPGPEQPAIASMSRSPANQLVRMPEYGSRPGTKGRQNVLTS